MDETTIDMTGVITALNELNNSLKWSKPSKQQFIIDVASNMFVNNSANSNLQKTADTCVKAAKIIYDRLARDGYFD